MISVKVLRSFSVTLLLAAMSVTIQAAHPAQAIGKSVLQPLQVANDYWIRIDGNDANTGSYFFPLKTLEGARAKLEALYPSKVVASSVTIHIDGHVLSKETWPYTLLWDISGTSAHPINIVGEGGFNHASLNRSSNDAAKNGYMLKINFADYINISGLTFNETTAGIWLNSASYCNINNNQFIGNTIQTTGGAGTIAITRSSLSDLLSIHNIITYNSFYNAGPSSVTGLTSGNPGANYYHAIYIAQCAYNTITYNTIIAPPAGGIHYYHGYSQYNEVSGNVISVCQKLKSNGSADQSALIMGTSSNGPNDGGVSTIFGNANVYNHLATSELAMNRNSGYVDLDNTVNFLINKSLVSTNPNYGGNRTHHANYNRDNYPIDPFWVELDPETLEGRTVTGDFDGDGAKDDIAAIMDMGDGSSQIHMWLNLRTLIIDILRGYADWEADDTFFYQGAWWTSTVGSTYDAAKIQGRVVAGDFNGDGVDDIGAMYDYGGGSARIHTWTNTGNNSFSPTGYANTWWVSNTGEYNANKVTNRFVSGDFNNDGKDDIAAMYDYGNANSRIHTWISGGSSFYPSGYAYTWWTPTGGYNAQKVAGRFVSGDYNGDGKTDLAAMYDYGSGNSRIHTWLSNGGSFQPSGYAYTWWTSAAGSTYDATKVGNRLVSGDFDGNGKWDLAAMYDYGGGSSRIHYWSSTGSRFGPNGYAFTGWRSSLGGYPVSNVGSRFLAGQFSEDNSWDLASFYDYSNSAMQRTRTHIWEKSGSTFSLPTSLGYPWMMNESELGMNCAH